MSRASVIFASLGLVLGGAIVVLLLELRGRVVDLEATPPARAAANESASSAPSPTTDPAQLAFDVQRLIERLDERSRNDATRELELRAKLDDLASQIYAHDLDVARNLMQLQTNVLRRLSQLESTAATAPPEDPVALREALAKSGVALNLSGGFIEMKGRFARPGRTLELAAVTDGGPAHETLLVIDGKPSALRQAMTKLGMKPGSGADHTGKPPTGDPVFLYVQWEGLSRAWRLEDLVVDLRDDLEMRDPNWVFTGSDWTSDMRTGEEYFIADGARVLIALAHKFSGQAVISSAHAEAHREDIWMPNVRAIPKEIEGLEVTLTIAPKRLEHLEWR